MAGTASTFAIALERLALIDQFPHVLRGEPGPGNQMQLKAPHRAHGGQVCRIEVQLVEIGIGRHLGGRTQEKGVAIRGSPDDLAGRDVPACARPVFDHDRLPQQLGERLRDDTRHHIGSAAWRIAEHQAYGLGRPCGLRMQRWGHGGEALPVRPRRPAVELISTLAAKSQLSAPGRWAIIGSDRRPGGCDLPPRRP